MARPREREAEAAKSSALQCPLPWSEALRGCTRGGRGRHIGCLFMGEIFTEVSLSMSKP